MQPQANSLADRSLGQVVEWSVRVWEGRSIAKSVLENGTGPRSAKSGRVSRRKIGVRDPGAISGLFFSCRLLLKSPASSSEPWLG